MGNISLGLPRSSTYSRETDSLVGPLHAPPLCPYLALLEIRGFARGTFLGEASYC